MLTYSFKINNISGSTLDIPIISTFSPETKKYEFVDENFDVVEMGVINPIIDYEKVRVHPTTSGDTTNDLISIDFNLHFYTGATTGWTTNSTNLIGDITGAGFSEDDIINKRQRLSKTFLRLSFYDSNDLKTQNLLFYSTIFLDADKYYSEYITSGITSPNLTTEFTVENPKITTLLKSFEGYYLYLFKDDIEKNNLSTIYVKFEYNNAINGKSLLFLPNKPNTPDGYNLSDLKDYMFLPIALLYDTNINKYTYQIGSNNISNVVINLYQAKVK